MSLSKLQDDMVGVEWGTNIHCWVFVRLDNTTIYASHNVSSITDHGTGDWTINFIEPTNHTNYTFSFGQEHGTGTGTQQINEHASYSRSVSSLRINNTDTSGLTDTNTTRATVAIYGGKNK